MHKIGVDGITRRVILTSIEAKRSELANDGKFQEDRR